MTYRVAINGFGRIGRDYIRCLVERGAPGEEYRSSRSTTSATPRRSPTCCSTTRPSAGCAVDVDPTAAA